MSIPVLFQTRPNGDLTNWALTAAYRSQVRLYDPSYAQGQDPLAYVEMRKDPVLETSCLQRVAMTASREWVVEPASDDPADVQVAKLARAWLQEIGRFDAARERLAWAFFYGSTYEEMRGSFEVRKLNGDDRPRRWFIVKEMVNVEKQRFSRFRENGELVWKMWDVLGTSGSQWVTLPEDEARWYVKHVHDDREGSLRYGRGIADALYVAWWAKSVALKEGLRGLERWAQGWITAKVLLDRDGDTTTTNALVVDEWIEVLDKMRSRHVLVHGDDAEVDVKETTGSGHQIVRDFLTYLDDQIRCLVLGSSLPTGGGGGESGSFARSKTEKDMTEARVQMDQANLDDTVSSDVLGLFFVMNGPTLRDAGLAEARPPRFRTMREEKQDSLKEAQVVEVAMRAQLPLPAAEVYRKIGYSQPKPGEPVILVKPMDPMGGGGGMGGGPGDEEGEPAGAGAGNPRDRFSGGSDDFKWPA